VEAQEFISWLNNGFDSLPRCKDPFFAKLWQDGKLIYGTKGGGLVQYDLFAELSARLVCATIYEKQQILLILPDSNRKMQAMLLATGLVMSSMDVIQTKQRGRKVLYFGLTTGIRSDLSNISIGKLPMADVFTQTYHRGDLEKLGRAIGTLPNVVCIYSPSDPLSAISKYSPLWVAIDCGDAVSIWWLSSLLEKLHQNHIPTIAWSLNPLASIRKDFQMVGAHIFMAPESKGIATLNIYNSFLQSPVTKIVPLIMHGPLEDVISFNLNNAYHSLAAAMSEKPGRLSQDTLAIGWRYLRSLERLGIPISLYDSESVQYWGVKPIGHLRHAFKRFVDVLHLEPSANIRNQILGAENYLDVVYDVLQKNDPPRWNALIDLCLADVSENHTRILVFPNAAQKSMFSFALLARTKTSENDLAKMHVRLASFKDAALELTSMHKTGLVDFSLGININSAYLNDNTIWDIIQVALPNQQLSEKMTPFLNYGKCGFLIYPYQMTVLFRLVRTWGEFLKHDNVGIVKTICELTHAEPPKHIPISRQTCELDETNIILGEQLSNVETSISKPIWEPKSEADEVAFLFKGDEEETSAGDYEDMILDEKHDLDNSQEIIFDKAVEVKFSGGWLGLFAPDMFLNVVQNTSIGSKIDGRYSKSLRPGDTVVYISGQKRQSLYELALSRVNKHPSIEIHLALIRQWQIEIRHGYANWHQQGHSLKELFSEMLKRGTQLETDMALRFWVSGYTLRPRDREDMRRIAEILDLPFTRQHYPRIYLAAERIHGIHISLSLRLNNWIKSGVTDANDDLIDEATGLTFSDIRDSLMPLHVESVREIPGPFHEFSLGKIERRIDGE
jgi:hypothetical protein